MRTVVIAALVASALLGGCSSTVRAKGDSIRALRIVTHAGDEKLVLHELEGDLVEERGERVVVVVKNAASFGRFEAVVDPDGADTRSDVRFPAKGLTYSWHGREVSLAGKSHGVDEPGRYVLDDQGAVIFTR